MNIPQLKCILFSDLKEPMAYLTHRQMTSTGPANTAKRFGGTIYFYAGGEEWRVETPECLVHKTNINRFSDEQQQLVLKCPQKWSQNMREKLRDATRVAFDSEQVRKPEGCDTFEQFWEHCRVPDLLSVETYAFSRRGRKPIFVPVFHAGQELTGVHCPDEGDTVKVCVRWTLCQSMDGERLHSGFRPIFAGGISIIRRAGLPSPIRTPWSWSQVDFTTLTIPMYNCVCVRMCAKIVSLDGSRIRVQPSDEFEAAMRAFHTKAAVEPWDHVVTLHSAGNVRAGGKLMATIVPTQNNNRVEWTCVKHRILPNQPKSTAAEAVAERVAAEVEEAGVERQKNAATRRKRSLDNTDMFCSEKTKRQCTPNDIDDHSEV